MLFIRADKLVKDKSLQTAKTKAAVFRSNSCYQFRNMPEVV